MISKQDFPAIYEQYSSAIYKYARRLLHDEYIAQDVVSDVFIRLMEKIEIGEGPRTNVRSYLYQTAYHCVVDEARRNRQLGPLELALDMKIDNETRPLELCGETQVLMELVSAAMESMSPRQRDALILQYLEHYTLDETGKHLRTNRNNAKSKRHLAINRVRQLLCNHVWEERQFK